MFATLEPRDLASLVCIVALAGCSSKSEPPPPVATPSAASSAEPFKVVSVEPASTKLTETRAGVRARYESECRSQGYFSRISMAHDLHSTVPLLAEVPVGHKTRSAPWGKVSLNNDSTGFDAVRFESPLPAADLFFAWAVSHADAERLRWWAMTPAGASLEDDIVNSDARSNIAVPGLPLGEATYVTFGHVDGEHVGSGGNHVLGFVIDGEAPIDMYFKVMVFHAHQAPPSDKISDVAAALGMPVPFELTSAATPIDHAIAKREEEGALAAVSWLATELTKEHDWNLWHDSLHLVHDEAAKLAASERAEDANSIYLAAEGVIHHQFEARRAPEHPCQMIPLTLYNLACAQAVRGDSEEALTTLRNAVTAGMTDVAWIRGDDDLAVLRENAEFQRLIAELENR